MSGVSAPSAHLAGPKAVSPVRRQLLAQSPLVRSANPLRLNAQGCGQHPLRFSFSPPPKPGISLTSCKLSYLKGCLLYLGVLYHRAFRISGPPCGWIHTLTYRQFQCGTTNASAELCTLVLLQLRGKKWPHLARRAHGGSTVTEAVAEP